MTDEPIDTTAEEIPGDEQAPASTAVVRRERRSEVIRPLNADQLAESFASAGQQMPAWTQPASAELATTTRDAIGWLLGDPAAANEVVAKLTADTDGELVAAVGRAVVMTISAHKNLQDAAVEPTTAEPAADPEPVQAELGATPA
jgi:hypothetical protein